MNTAECIEFIEAEDISALSRLIDEPGEWKRISKFKYKDGIRRYFYLTNSIILATVDEVDEQPTVVVRPPMQWELYMIQNIRPNDAFCEEAIDLHDDHYDFCNSLACIHSEPEQYSFTVGDDDGGWIFFSPIKYPEYDQHLSDDLNGILPAHLRDEEIMECTYSYPGIDVDATKKEFVALGFEYYKE